MNANRHVCVACATLGLVALACKGGDPTATTTTRTTSTPNTAAPAPTTTLGDEIDKRSTWSAAAAFAGQHSDADVDKQSTATVLMALWMMRRGTWSDVSVATDETGYALARKDIAAERGKRFCVSGQIIQITSNTTADGKFAEGLMSNGVNVYHFLGVRSSGSLVEDSSARFCGVLMDLYDYSNSAGGTGHSVDVVGMFDLPENRAVRVAKPL